MKIVLIIGSHLRHIYFANQISSQFSNTAVVVEDRGSIIKKVNKNLNKLDKEKPYIIYCMSGNRSSKASHVMKSLGFKIIYHYKKGYKDWIKD